MKFFLTLLSFLFLCCSCSTDSSENIDNQPNNNDTSDSIVNYTITASAGMGGSISPSGKVLVSEGYSQKFKIIPSSDYEISNIKIDGNNVDGDSIYIFENVTSNHTISSEFVLVQKMNVFPDSIDFGDSELSYDFYIEDTSGKDTLSWTIITDSPWISFMPENGTGSDSINVKIDKTDMTEGSYNGDIEVFTSSGDTMNIYISMKVTSQVDLCALRGFNWADKRDNFVDSLLLLSGFNYSDTYDDALATSKTILTEWKDKGANAIRIPVNPSTVSNTEWWDVYKAAIDEAVSLDLNVIICCWDSKSSKNGKVDDLTKFISMWQSIIDEYGDDSHIYCEVFNEPHGYGTSSLKSLYTNWLSTFSDFPHSRVILDGKGYAQDVSSIGDQFDDCLLAFHIYSWFFGLYHTLSGWYDCVNSCIGEYKDRTIISEFGATMNSGLDYMTEPDSESTQSTNLKKICFIRGVTEYCRDNNISNIYWPGLRDGDSYSVYSFGSYMKIKNDSGLKRIEYGWGKDVDSL